MYYAPDLFVLYCVHNIYGLFANRALMSNRIILIVTLVPVEINALLLLLL